MSHTITSAILNRFYEPLQAKSYFNILDNSTDETDSIYEVVEEDEVPTELPNDIQNPDRIVRVNEELFEHIDGDQYDTVDADARGVIIAMISGLIIFLTAPLIGFLAFKSLGVILGIVLSAVSLALVLYQYQEMVDVIEYSSQEVQS